MLNAKNILRDLLEQAQGLRGVAHLWRSQQDISTVHLFDSRKKKKKSLPFIPRIDFLSAVTLVLLAFF